MPFAAPAGPNPCATACFTVSESKTGSASGPDRGYAVEPDKRSARRYTACIPHKRSKRPPDSDWPSRRSTDSCLVNSTRMLWTVPWEHSIGRLQALRSALCADPVRHATA